MASAFLKNTVQYWHETERPKDRCLVPAHYVRNAGKVRREMPKKGVRDESIMLTCAWCSKKFNPWKYHKINAYCSKACSNRALMARINGQDVSVDTPLPTRSADNTTLGNTVISELDKSD